MPRPNSPPDPGGQRRGQRLLFVAGVFLVLLSFPLLGAVDGGGRVGGVPALYLYVLVLWLALIGITRLLVK